MTTQYENLATLDTWNDFFKVAPAELPAEHQMRARRMSGLIRGHVLPEPTAAEVPASDATAGSSKKTVRGARVGARAMGLCAQLGQICQGCQAACPQAAGGAQ